MYKDPFDKEEIKSLSPEEAKKKILDIADMQGLPGKLKDRLSDSKPGLRFAE